MDGLRLEKTAGGVTTQYQYVNGQLLGEKRSNGVILRYTYDALGVLIGIQYKNTAGVTTNYIVRCTLSGDVNQIYDTKGNLLARYIYDTWGDTLSVTDASGKAITDPLHIANINPIRYRGYYYDAETGLYYLQSRYYDTTTRRFLNADEILGANSDINALNLYAYCGNNPINLIDWSGEYPIEVGESSTEIKRDYSGIRFAQKKKEQGHTNDVPYTGIPGSTAKSPDGTKERVYGDNGLPSRDRHYTDHGNPSKHPYVPHDHDWGYNEQGEWDIGEGYKSPSGKLQPQEFANAGIGSDCVTGTVAAGIIVIVIYEVAKWGVAGALAPVSGGTSLAGAAMLP